MNGVAMLIGFWVLGCGGAVVIKGSGASSDEDRAFAASPSSPSAGSGPSGLQSHCAALWRRLNNWLFAANGPDDIADIRGALAVLVKRAMNEGDFTLTLYGCSIRGVPVGDWCVEVSRALPKARGEHND